MTLKKDSKSITFLLKSNWKFITTVLDCNQNCTYYIRKNILFYYFLIKSM